MSDNTKSQSDKFKEAARELGADTDEATFDRALAKIAPVDKNADVGYSNTAQKAGAPDESKSGE